MKWVQGSSLKPEVQQEVLRRFVNRFTRDHKPAWAQGGVYKVQFRSDAEWLQNTSFAVTSFGTLDKRVRFCRSVPTFPDGPSMGKGLNGEVEQCTHSAS